uniref:uncharacterized protein n=1 Tax=Myxine glutinosa TaxID=7769 RepID=UPI00358FDF1D
MTMHLKRLASIFKRKTSEGKPRDGRDLHLRLHLGLHPALHSKGYITKLRDIAMELKKMCPSLRSLHHKSILSTNSESKKYSSMPDDKKFANTQTSDRTLAIPVTSKSKAAEKTLENQSNHSDRQVRTPEPDAVKYLEFKNMYKNNLNTTSQGGNSLPPTNGTSVQIPINITRQANKTIMQLYCEFKNNHNNYKGLTKSQLVNKEMKSRCSNHSPLFELKSRKHLRLKRQVKASVTGPPSTSRRIQKGTPGQLSLASSPYQQPIPSNFRKSNVLQGNNFRPFANIPQGKMTFGKKLQPHVRAMPKTSTNLPISKKFQPGSRLFPQSSSRIPQIPRRLFSKNTKNDPNQAAAQAPQIGIPNTTSRLPLATADKASVYGRKQFTAKLPFQKPPMGPAKIIPKITTRPSIQGNRAPALGRPRFTAKLPFQKPPMGPAKIIPKITTRPSIQGNRAPALGRPRFTAKLPFQKPPMGPARIIPKITTRPSTQENRAPALGRPRFTAKLPFQKPPMGPARMIPKLTTRPSTQENRAPALGRPRFTAKLPFQKPPMGPARIIPKITTRPSTQGNRAPALGRPQFTAKLPFQKPPMGPARIIPKITTRPSTQGNRAPALGRPQFTAKLPFQKPPMGPARIIPKITTRPSTQGNRAPALGRPQFTAKLPFQKPPMGPARIIPKITTRPSTQENRAPALGRPQFTAKLPFQRPPMGPAKIIPKITARPSTQGNRAPASGRPQFTATLPFQRPPMGPAKIIPKITTRPSTQENRAPASGRPQFTATLPFQRPPMGPAKIIPKITTNPPFIPPLRAPTQIVPKISQSTEEIVPFPPESTQQTRPEPLNNIGSLESSPNQQTEAADIGNGANKVEYLGKASEALNTIRKRPSTKVAPLRPALQASEMNNIQPMSQSEENALPVVPSQSNPVPVLVNGEPVASSLSPSKVMLPYLDGHEENVAQDSFSSDLSNEEASSTKYLLSQINNHKGGKNNQSNTPSGNIHIIEQHNIRGSSIIQVINDNCGTFVSKSLDEFLNCLKATKLTDIPNLNDIATNMHHKVQRSKFNTPAVPTELMKTPTRRRFLNKRNVEHVRNKRSATSYNREFPRKLPFMVPGCITIGILALLYLLRLLVYPNKGQAKCNKKKFISRQLMYGVSLQNSPYPQSTSLWWNKEKNILPSCVEPQAMLRHIRHAERSVVMVISQDVVNNYPVP